MELDSRRMISLVFFSVPYLVMERHLLTFPSSKFIRSNNLRRRVLWSHFHLNELKLNRKYPIILDMLLVTHTHTHTRTHTHTHTPTYVYKHTYTHTLSYTRIYTHTHIHTHTYSHTHIHTHTHTHIYADIGFE